MAEPSDLDERITQLRRAGFNRKAIAALVNLTETQLAGAIADPAADDPTPAAPAVDLTTVEDRLAALEAGGGGGEASVPATLVDEVGDHATRIAALEAALNVVPAGHDPIPLTFSAAGDTNGLFYWLGTNGGQAAWQNPALASPPRVTIDATPAAPDGFSGAASSAPENVVNRADAHYGSDGSLAPPHHIAFDLGGRRMMVTKYVMRGRADKPDYMLKNWKLQGSQDGSAWTDLDSHSDDFTLVGWSGVGAFAGWTVANATSWRWLRILQTGVNGDGGNALNVGELEFYGVLIP